MKKALILIFLLGNFSAWADQFEKDLKAIKSKYNVLDKSTKWSDVTEDDLEGDLSPKIDKKINRADLMFNFEYFFFKDKLSDISKINSEMSKIGIDLEMIFSTGSLLDVLFYTSFGYTSDVTFAGTNNIYETPNTFNVGIGPYLTRGFQKINPFLSLEFETLSAVGVDQDQAADGGIVFDFMSGNSIQSVNLLFGMDHPFYLITRPTYLRAYLGTALYGVSKLEQSSYEEKINVFKIGTSLKMEFIEHALFVLGWKGEIITGITNSYLSHFNLNLGYSF
ncbi:MAG: hypothetical protein DRQ88_07455 [Epsilonproteobacteria bacterium]|nr:MAG: hypothetical protein DRQ89_07890 [Campylobacterota bacterium]RLA66234.1 MAG: hypothetical protein DRQ88_07455 [Campylobacterota bacterium]